MRLFNFFTPRGRNKSSLWLIIIILAVTAGLKSGKFSGFIPAAREPKTNNKAALLTTPSGDVNTAAFSPGHPVKKGQKGQMLYRAGYTSFYNVMALQPYWVAWTLTREHCTGGSKRDSEEFAEDTDVPYPRADTYDYIGSGYDRGHMCPAADNKWSGGAMTQSFLMTNICPQHPELNRGDWNEIEQQCRVWAKAYGKVYIVCGPILLNKSHKRIGKHKIPVPDAFFKVVLRTSPDIKGIGFICRNTAGNHPKDFYVNSIREVERITGYTFFPKFGTDMKYKRTASLKDWKYKPTRYGK